MRAWVKAQDVVGYAGWYVHVGNEKNFMLIAPMLSGGAGTYGWKEVVAEFTAPAEADRADLGTVLYGTGTAWFDDVSLECLDPARLSATAGPRESLTFTQSGADAPWYDDDAADGRTWDYRVPVRVANYSDTPAATGLISVDLAGVFARLRGRADRDSLRVVLGGQLVKSYQLKDLLLIEGEPVPPHTGQVYYLYVAASKKSGPAAVGETLATNTANPALPGAQTAGPKVGGGPDYETLLSGPRNLVRNPNFEIGDTLPDNWSGGAAGERPADAQMSLVEPGLFGAPMRRISIPHNSASAWFGWRQDVRVEPNKTYLYAAWLKCEDLAGGVQLHAHFRNAAGELCEKAQMTGAGPAVSGTTDWTLLSGLFTMPEDIANFQLHLTMNATGTAWHDGTVLVEVSAGQVGRMQSRVSVADQGVKVWPVNSVVKVFQDDVAARTQCPPASVWRATKWSHCSSQFARTARYRRCECKWMPAQRGRRRRLAAWRSASLVTCRSTIPPTTTTRRLPPGSASTPHPAPACDGWAGYWPDPLLPRDTFDLNAGATQPVWVTFKTAADTAPGDYTGTVRFVGGGDGDRACALHRPRVGLRIAQGEPRGGDLRPAHGQPVEYSWQDTCGSSSRLSEVHGGSPRLPGHHRPGTGHPL